MEQLDTFTKAHRANVGLIVAFIDVSSDPLPSTTGTGLTSLRYELLSLLVVWHPLKTNHIAYSIHTYMYIQLLAITAVASRVLLHSVILWP